MESASGGAQIVTIRCPQNAYRRCRSVSLAVTTKRMKVPIKSFFLSLPVTQ